MILFTVLSDIVFIIALSMTFLYNHLSLFFYSDANKQTHNGVLRTVARKKIIQYRQLYID